MQSREQCPICENYNLILTLSTGVKVCKSCKNPLPSIVRNCLKCEVDFMAVNKFNRVCNVCTHQIEGIVLYGLGNN